MKFEEFYKFLIVLKIFSHPSAHLLAPATAIATKLLLNVIGDPLKRKMLRIFCQFPVNFSNLSPKQIPCSFLLKVHKCPLPKGGDVKRRLLLYSRNCWLHLFNANCFRFNVKSWSEVELLKFVLPKPVNDNFALSRTFDLEKFMGWMFSLYLISLLSLTSAISLWWRKGLSILKFRNLCWWILKRLS